MKKVSKEILQKFHTNYVVLDNGCWQWVAGKEKAGYSKFWDGVYSVRGHRFSYIIFKGKIKKGTHIDHVCKNKLCVNPEHLEMVSPRENALRGRQTKLTYGEVAVIRSLSKEKTRIEIAKIFGVSCCYVSKIINMHHRVYG